MRGLRGRRRPLRRGEGAREAPLGREIPYTTSWKAVPETTSVLGLRQKLLYTTPSGWWWSINSLFRATEVRRRPFFRTNVCFLVPIFVF